MTGRVLAHLYSYCIYREIADAVFALSETHTVDVTAATPGVLPTGDGIGIEAPLARSDVLARDYRAVLVPGGDVEEALGDAEGLHTLGQIASRPGVVVGAICNGVVVLGAAGILAGRRVTHTVRAPWASEGHLAVLGPHVADAAFVDDDVVIDGDLITAKPWAAEAFAHAVLDTLAGRAPR